MLYAYYVHLNKYFYFILLKCYFKVTSKLSMSNFFKILVLR
jgi:hypothetical protein